MGDVCEGDTIVLHRLLFSSFVIFIFFFFLFVSFFLSYPGVLSALHAASLQHIGYTVLPFTTKTRISKFINHSSSSFLFPSSYFLFNLPYYCLTKTPKPLSTVETKPLPFIFFFEFCIMFITYVQAVIRPSLAVGPKLVV